MLEIFTQYRLDNSGVYLWRLNTLNLWIKRRDEELFIAHTYGEQAGEPVLGARSEDVPPLEWTRMFTACRSEKITLAPLMPDRPVVVRSEETIRILPRQKKHYFVLIPLWVQIIEENSREQVLYEVPTMQLSNTWFGDVATGVLSYTVDSPICPDFSYTEGSPCHALCPVLIKNNSRHFFDFKQMSIYAQFLHIYHTQHNLWNNRVIITFAEEDKINIQIEDKRPFFEKDEVLLARQRKFDDSNILRKSITIFIKSLTGIDVD